MHFLFARARTPWSFFIQAPCSEATLRKFGFGFGRNPYQMHQNPGVDSTTVKIFTYFNASEFSRALMQLELKLWDAEMFLLELKIKIKP